MAGRRDSRKREPAISLSEYRVSTLSRRLFSPETKSGQPWEGGKEGRKTIVPQFVRFPDIWLSFNCLDIRGGEGGGPK